MSRSKGEIIANILEICLTVSSKTVIVNGSHLNFRTLNPYLDSLVEHGFIAVIEGDPLKYETTDKGKELLAVIRKTNELF
ncbi:MAG: winged helix-turn-helix domain-containing protein [Methanotrichaceae archaeon]